MAKNGQAPSLAVLIDADNTSARYAQPIFDEIVKLGEANVRRIYGDFSSNRLAGWNGAIQSLAILQHQQRSNTTGKNAADIALVIDAMDLMHKGKLDGFCLVSSDSDFTRLAQRLREDGLVVGDDDGWAHLGTVGSRIQGAAQSVPPFRKQFLDAVPDEALRLEGEYIDLASD